MCASVIRPRELVRSAQTVRRQRADAGKCRDELGPGLKQVIENQAGDFIYIKPDVPHEVFNTSATEPVVAFVARSSAEEWDNIIPYHRARQS